MPVRSVDKVELRNRDLYGKRKACAVLSLALIC